MPKNSKFVLLEDVLTEMGYMPECIDIQLLGVVLLRQGLKCMLTISETTTESRFYDNQSLRKYITKYVWSCLKQ